MALHPEPEEASALSGLRMLGQEAEDASGSVLIACAGIEARFKLPNPLQGQNGEGGMVYYAGKWISPNRFEEACGMKGKVWRRSFLVHTGSPQDKDGWVRMDEWLRRVNNAHNNMGIGTSGAEAQTRFHNKQESEPGQSAESETESAPPMNGKRQQSRTSHDSLEPARAERGVGGIKQPTPANKSKSSTPAAPLPPQPTEAAQPAENKSKPFAPAPAVQSSPANASEAAQPTENKSKASTPAAANAAADAAADEAAAAAAAVAERRKDRQQRFSQFLKESKLVGSGKSHSAPTSRIGAPQTSNQQPTNQQPTNQQAAASQTQPGQANRSSTQMPPPPSPKHKPSQTQPTNAHKSGKNQPTNTQHNSAKNQLTNGQQNSSKGQPTSTQKNSAKTQPEDKAKAGAGGNTVAAAAPSKQAEGSKTTNAGGAAKASKQTEQGSKAANGAYSSKQGQGAEAGVRYQTRRSTIQQVPPSQQQAEGPSNPSMSVMLASRTRRSAQQVPPSQQQAEAPSNPSSSSSQGVKRSTSMTDIDPEAKRQRIEQNLREAREAEEQAAAAAAAAAEKRARLQQQEEQWKETMARLEEERGECEAAEKLVQELEEQKERELERALEELKQKQAQELQEPRQALQDRQAAVEEAERAVAAAEEDFWKCCQQGSI